MLGSVLNRVRESSESARNNALGALAVVPAPEWEQRAAELNAAVEAEAAGLVTPPDSDSGDQPAELEQTSQLAQVGGLDGLRERTNSLTQVLASVQDYIAKIDQDIVTDYASLKHE